MTTEQEYLSHCDFQHTDLAKLYDALRDRSIIRHAHAIKPFPAAYSPKIFSTVLCMSSVSHTMS